MTSAEIRQAFIDFFKEKHGHTVVPSSPVVPLDDPTLLFINAGMNQFKDVFLGTGTRDYTRAVDSQKCIRVSGKHNDLEEVGPSPNHHTFFEMLGNWSFGDYYKAEAIRWAWQLMTEVYGLPKDKLHATVFTDDDEAHELWKSETDINPDHISRHGHKDNFWEMGEVGPCGPCTEIHYDFGRAAPGREPIENDGPNTESGRFIELWNLVFIQYHRDKSGELHELPAKHVDTGAGLERIARVLQGVNSNYETDLFQPIISEIAERSGVAYELDGIHIPHRVIADHLRSLSFAIADGALPGNEGRGYVLRRILRRASRYIRELGVDGPFLHTLVPALVDVLGHHFTEIRDRQQHIETVIKAEEESFLRTLDKGISQFEQSIFDGFWNTLQNDSDFRFVIRKANEEVEELNKLFLKQIIDKPTWFEDYRLLIKSYVEWYGDETSTPMLAGSIRILNGTLFENLYNAANSTHMPEDERDRLIELIKINESRSQQIQQFIRRIRISGEDAFKLYDTYGFPLDLTEQMARERGIEVDVEGFKREMEEAKERSRAGAKFQAGDNNFVTVTEGSHSHFTGYDSFEEHTEVRMIREESSEGGPISSANRESDMAGASAPDAKTSDVHQTGAEAPAINPRYAIVLAESPFYAESGGQVADYGTIEGDGWVFRVYDVRMEGDRRVHYAEASVQPENNEWPRTVLAKIDVNRRQDILPHHTTTHLLQAALRRVLGDHVTQAGSRVTPDYMTFDFTHFEKPSDEQLAEAERLVNQVIREDLPVQAGHMSLKEAKAKGAMALFGEKYSEDVRVITIGDNDGDHYSMELCGGTHLSRTGQAGLFRIESETGLSAGVRRVECTAGAAAYRKMNEERAILERVVETVGSGGSDPADKIEKLLDRQRELQKEIERLQQAALKGGVDMLADWGEEMEYKGENILAVYSLYDAASDKQGLQKAGDEIVERLKKAGREGFGVVGAPLGATFMFVAVVTPGLIKQGLKAGQLVGAIAQQAGGGGGGKPDFATAGTKQIDDAKLLLSDRPRFRKVLEEILG